MKNFNCLAKIVAVERILQSDPEGVSVKSIIEKLENYYCMKAERKAVYNYIVTLTRFMPIVEIKKGRTNFYGLQGGLNNDI